MRALALVVVACSAPAAPPAVSNARVAPPAAAQSVTCGSVDGTARCFATHPACTAELENCRDVSAPQWTCARSTATGMTHDALDLCLPSAALCASEPQIAEEHRQPCRQVPEVYCRGGSELICHPTRAICEHEAKTLVSFGGEPSACTRH